MIKSILLMGLSILLATATWMGIVAFFYNFEPSIDGLVFVCMFSAVGFVFSYLVFAEGRKAIVIPETDIQRRLRWYKIALKEIESGKENWICFAIMNNCSEFMKLGNKYACHELLPELHKWRTVWQEAVWFKDKEERIAALRTVIKQLEM
ncbi:MAG: hypothetical protein WCK31_04730 [bacterium]